ncbi:META domain-containing protein [Streptomyces sp. NPDC048506]|uniref:META domain-containing protein n=1 Tax=Streptomyces sp. NPDC048506 TaxID=3155028 RepID=UPI0034218741
MRNEHGDALSVSQIRPQGFFDIRWQLTEWTAEDLTEDFKSGKDLYFDFHPNGTVTGKLGCNDFTAKVFFSGVHVIFRDPKLTTHRTCAAPNMADEAQVVRALANAEIYQYSTHTESLSLQTDIADIERSTGLRFKAMPKR